jgi:acyl-coenzyme A thioesterase PaaI-like protein
MLHGGVIAALADNAMGLSLGAALGEAAKIAGVSGIVTTSLSVDYLGVAQQGQWIEIAPRVVKASSGSGVVDALITADGDTIARANASFRILK